MPANIQMPPVFDENNGLRQVYSYLYQMSEQLNNALNSISADQLISEDQKALTALKEGTNAVSIAEQAALDSQANRLQSLIIQNANSIQTYVDTSISTMRSEYVAESEFGEYQEQVTQTISNTTSQIAETYASKQTVNSLVEGQTDFQNRITQIEGNIIRGYVQVDGVRDFGIAITKQVTIGEADENGYHQLSNIRSMVFVTSDKMSFYQNGTQVAYISNNKLFITQGQLLSNLQIGNVVMYQNGDSLDFKGASS